MPAILYLQQLGATWLGKLSERNKYRKREGKESERARKSKNEREREGDRERQELANVENMNLKIHNCIFRSGTPEPPQQFMGNTSRAPSPIESWSSVCTCLKIAPNSARTTQSMLTNNQTLIRHVDWKTGTVAQEHLKPHGKYYK